MCIKYISKSVISILMSRVKWNSISDNPRKNKYGFHTKFEIQLHNTFVFLCSLETKWRENKQLSTIHIYNVQIFILYLEGDDFLGVKQRLSYWTQPISFWQEISSLAQEPYQDATPRTHHSMPLGNLPRVLPPPPPPPSPH